MVEIQIEGERVLLANLEQRPTQYLRAGVRATNRTMGTARTLLARAVAAKTNIRVNKVRDNLIVTKATWENPVASIRASRRRLPLILFGARGNRPSRGRGPGVRTRVPAELGTYRNQYPRAFIATVRRAGTDGFHEGHEGVFVRVPGSSRKSAGAWSPNLPIKQLFGPSLWKAGVKLTPEMLPALRATWARNFAHETQYLESKETGAGAD